MKIANSMETGNKHTKPIDNKDKCWKLHWKLFGNQWKLQNHENRPQDHKKQQGFQFLVYRGETWKLFFNMETNWETRWKP